MNCKLTHSRLLQSLRYEPESGNFFWLVSPAKNVKAGAQAGCVKGTGYVLIAFDKEQFLGHRLAWFYVHGEWPVQHIDHINGNRADNQIGNLRLATVAENMQNQRGPARGNITGFLGVSPNPKRSAFRAGIRVDGLKKHLGTFTTPELAHQAYVEAKRQFHPRGTL